jgi:hypothetical protein
VTLPFSPGSSVPTPPPALNQLATASPFIALPSIATISASSRLPWTWTSWASDSPLALLVKVISAGPACALGGAWNLMSSLDPVAVIAILAGGFCWLLWLFSELLPPQPATRPAGTKTATAVHRNPFKLTPASLSLVHPRFE